MGVRTKPTFCFACHTATEKSAGTTSLRGPRNTELPMWLARQACFLGSFRSDFVSASGTTLVHQRRCWTGSSIQMIGQRKNILFWESTPSPFWSQKPISGSSTTCQRGPKNQASGQRPGTKSQNLYVQGEPPQGLIKWSRWQGNTLEHIFL